MGINPGDKANEWDKVCEGEMVWGEKVEKTRREKGGGRYMVLYKGI